MSFFATPGSNIWANGITQNIAFLVQLLRRSPVVNKVFLLNGGDAEQPPPEMEFDGLSVPVVRPRDVTHELDVVIEMGAVLPQEWMRHAHACGVRFVCFGVGHNYSAVAEGMLFGKGDGIFLTDPGLRVETWGLPHHGKTAASMMETLTRKPVVEMPHLWSPYFLEKKIQSLPPEEGGFGFRAFTASGERKPWKVGIFEPNIGVVKNCALPMLVCEQAYRNLPESIAGMMVLNSVQMKEHPTFLRFALQLDLTRHHKATYEPRVQFSDAMVRCRLDAVVAHHWECGLNYAYYDALYGGYPLIHNSDFLRDRSQGFYYPEFSARQGAEAFVDAWRQPAGFWEDYRRRAADYLQTLSPEHPENIRIFSERLLHVAGRAA